MPLTATTTIKVATGYRAILTDAGFEPVAGCKKIAGAPVFWRDRDGRTASVGYSLLSRTAQRSLGAAATWGYVVSFP